jgi:hypothetical protein
MGIHPTRCRRCLAQAAVADTEAHRAHLEWIDMNLLIVVEVYFDRLLCRARNPWVRREPRFNYRTVSHEYIRSLCIQQDQHLISDMQREELYHSPSKDQNPVNKNTGKYFFFSMLLHHSQAEVKRPADKSSDMKTTVRIRTDHLCKSQRRRNCPRHSHRSRA